MLVSALAYKAEIEELFAKNMYSDSLGLYYGDFYNNYIPEICREYVEGHFEYAIINSKEEIIGYFNYDIDFCNDCVYNFGLYSFHKGSYTVGKDIYTEMMKLFKRHHRIEWRMIDCNPAQRSYDKFCQKHGGRKIELRDTVIDKNGNYHNSYIYEIIRK